MPITIVEDLVLGARLIVNRDGGALTRVFFVSGLTPGVDTLASVYGVSDGSGASIPNYGQAHPTAFGFYVSAIEAEPFPEDSRISAKVVVRYGPPELAPAIGTVEVTITGSTGTNQVNQYADGSPIVVSYRDPAGNLLQDRIEVSILSPNTILQFIRQDSSSSLALSLAYRRTVNATPWQGAPARSWLCRAIDSQSRSAGQRWETRLVFEYDPRGWQRWEYYVDRVTGKVPDDVTLNPPNFDGGILPVLPYGTADFNALGLPGVL